MVENQCSQISLLLTSLLFITAIVSVVSGQTTGVYLSLNGTAIPNDGYVLASDIGEQNASLHCNTDRSNCCRQIDHPNATAAQGEWHYPNGSQVQSFTHEKALDPTKNFFYRNRFTQAVRLNRIGDPPQRGRFRCEVPNADGDNVTVYVNIVGGPAIPPTTVTITDFPITASDTTKSYRPDIISTQKLGSVSTELPGEAVTATVISESCARNVGIAVGGLILVEGIIAAVAAIIVTVICWKRKSGKSTSDFALSTNMAYGQVRLEGLGDESGEYYEDPDKMARSGRGGGN